MSRPRPEPTKSLLYYVVEFTSEEVDGHMPMNVVPNSWVTTNANDNTLECIWPRIGTDADRVKLVKNNQLPKSYTTGNKVNVKFKAFNYYNAIEKMKQLENGYSFSEAEDNNQSKRKRKPKVVYSDCDSSSSEGKPPLIKKPVSKVHDNVSQHSSSDSNNDVLCTINSTSTINTNLSSEENLNNLISDGTSSSTTSAVIECKCQENNTLLQTILAEVRRLRQTVDSENLEDEEIDYGFTFPLNNIEQISAFNNFLAEQKHRTLMIPKFTVLGGKDAIECTRRIMAKLMSQNIAELFNWSGQNNKPSFKKMENITRFIIGVVRRHRSCAEATQKDVEDVIKVWLRNASDRNGGRSKRKMRE